MQIAVCEDDAAILEIIAISLEDMGHNVESAINIQQIKAIIDTVELDLLVVDYWLRDTNAEQVLAYLGASKLNSNVPAILISALPDLKQLGEKLAVAAVVSKPFDLADFQATINKILLPK